MNFNTTRSITVVLAGLLVLSVVPMGGMAVPSTDTAGTQQTEVTDGATYTTFNASGPIGWLNATYDSNNVALEIIDPDTNEVVNRFGNASSRWELYNTTSRGINLTESDFATMPMDANQNKSVTLRLIGNTSADNPPMTNLTIYLENTDERAVVHAGSTATGDGGIAEVDEVETRGWSFWSTSTENTTMLEADNVGVNGTATDVYVVYADETVAEPYETAAANKSVLWGLSTSDYADGDQIKDQVGFVDGMAYGIYYNEVPEDADNAEDHTYYTWTSVNGESAHMINLGEDFEDETSVDVETIGNDTPEFGVDVQTLDTGGWFSLQASPPGLYGPTGA